MQSYFYDCFVEQGANTDSSESNPTQRFTLHYSYASV